MNALVDAWYDIGDTCDRAARAFDGLREQLLITQAHAIAGKTGRDWFDVLQQLRFS